MTMVRLLMTTTAALIGTAAATKAALPTGTSFCGSDGSGLIAPVFVKVKDTTSMDIAVTVLGTTTNCEAEVNILICSMTETMINS